jgi:lipoprotein-anchoring transpeptidase ErfK/SrfK
MAAEHETRMLGSMRYTSGRRRRLLPVAAATVVAHALLLGAGATAASAETSAQPSPGTTPVAATSPRALSNERTSTTWAHPIEEAAIRARPATSSRPLARTHLATEDGFPEVYLALASVTDARGREWIEVRIPGRPNGRTGWVTRAVLGEFRVTHWLVEIVRRSRRLYAYYNGKLQLSAPVGVGKPGTPTPAGHFYIREIFKLARGNAYGPYAMGTSDYSTLTDWPGGGVVGIHGDLGEPKLVPGDPSHGCVRMHDGDLSRLASRLTLGTPVHIV